LRFTATGLHHKVISRLQDGQGEALPRALPALAGALRLDARLDVLVLEKVLAHLRGHDQVLALNLSAATLADPGPAARLRAVGQNAALGPRLVLEIGEEQLPEQAAWSNSPGACTGWLRPGAAALGGRFSMIGNLAHLGLAYLKIDGSYIRNIDHEQHKRLFIEAIQRGGAQHRPAADCRAGRDRGSGGCCRRWG
jgi:EAL domain-containing protein (putative c-di-GMP-specific phosphodiesterase class I)